MRLDRLRLKNFCQFADFEVRFQEGLNLIVGPNGSGKSNTLKAAFAAVTGDFSRNDGKQEENIRDLSGDEPSEIELDFTHAGRPVNVIRRLRPVGRELRLTDGARAYTGDKDVAQRIFGLLDVTPEILSEYVFVDQWEVFSVFSLSPKKRAEAFGRLFRVDKIQKVWDELGKAAAKVVVPELQTDKDELLRRRDAAEAEADACDAELAATPADGIDDATAASARNLVAASERFAYLSKEIETREQNLGYNLAEIDRYQTDLNALLSDEKVLREAESATVPAVTAARTALAHWREYRRVSAIRAQLDAQAVQLQKELADHPPPVRPADYITDRDAVAAELRKLSDERAVHWGHAETLIALDGKTNCPTCGEPVDRHRLDDHTAHARAECERLRPLIEALKDRAERSLAYDKNAALYAQWRRSWDQSVEAHRRQSELAVVAAPEMTTEAANAAIEEHDRVAESVREIGGEVQELRLRLERLSTRREAEQRELDRVRAERAALPATTPDIVQRARGVIDLHQRTIEVRKRRAELEGRSLHLRRSVADMDAEVNRLYTAQLAAQRSLGLKAHLEDMREVVHFSNLQRLVSLHYLSKLTSDVNAYLSLFDSPFRVEVDDSLTFTAVFHGGRRRPAGRLSGGQKVVLALAFRLSVNSAFASELGLLCLDEPTVGLDEHNLGCLEVALGRLRELSRSTGLQVIMVTHERSLAPLFDNAVSFYPDG